MAIQFDLPPHDRLILSCAVIASIEGCLGLREPQPAPIPSDYSEMLNQQLGAFVTLTSHGALRGCIGNIVGREPLILTVWHMAQAAAFSDPRFPPLAAREWPEITAEITVLDELRPCPDPDLIEIGRHGLVLSLQGRTGVFLPQVPVEQGWDRAAYLSNLCRKAGVPDRSWMHPAAQLFWYEGLVFPVQKS